MRRMTQSMALYDHVPISGSPGSHDVRQFTFYSHMPPMSGPPVSHSGCHQP